MRRGASDGTRRTLRCTGAAGEGAAREGPQWQGEGLVTMFSEEYWLQHCEGFRIRTPSGYEGFVEGVMLDRRRGRPGRLSVRCHRRLIDVEAADVDLVLPESETLVLRRALPRATGARRASAAAVQSGETIE
jgi:hypothetical protein